MRRAIVIVVVVLIGVAFVAGFWPQYRQLTEARKQLQETQNRLTAAEGRIRLADLLGRLLTLSDAVASKNYGDAAALSSSFFDAVRIEALRAEQPAVTATLQTILNSRDQVTTAVAGTDAALSTMLKEHERSLRRALGHPMDGAPGKP